MNIRRGCLLAVFLLAFFATSCASEKVIKGDGNPDMSKYVGGRLVDLTTKDDEFFYPKYEMYITKKTEYRIMEYEIHYQYVFGQNWDVYLDERKHYYPEDIEMKQLNKQGFFVIKFELEKIPIEKVYDPSSYYGELNYRSVDAQDCYLKIDLKNRSKVLPETKE